MAIVAMADAVPGTIASSSEYNKIIDNVEDVDKRLIETWAGRLVTTAGTLLTTSGTTEATINNLTMDTTKPLTSGQYYELNLAVSANPSNANEQFLFRVRHTTALSGTVIAEFRWNTGPAGFTDTVNFSLPIRISSTISNAKLYVSILRNAGTGTASVFGNSVTAFSVKHFGSDTSMWSLT